MESVRETLAHFGLNESDVDIYLTLTKNGELDAGSLAKKSGVSRTTAHDSIKNLQKLNLIEHRKQGRNAFYSPAHPQQLSVLIEQKKSEQSLLMQNMEESIRQLSAEYNAASGRPGVRFYEGTQGFSDALNRSLQSTETIVAMVNSDNADKYVSEIDQTYVQQRLKKGIKKQIIMVDTPAAREYAQEHGGELTEIRFMDGDKYPFDSAMEVYDNAVTHLIADKKAQIAFLIEDPHVAQLQKSIFRFVWDSLPQ
jgi:sugar-specific transcriptional regulator TrmB